MKLNQWLFTHFFLLLILFGCSKEVPIQEQLDNVYQFDLSTAPVIKLVQDPGFEIGSYQSINNMGDIAVDGVGQVYVVNEFKKRIEVFDKDGEQIAAIGRAGGDPGEFQNPGSIAVINDKLYAYDKNMYKGYRYSLVNYEVRSTNLDIGSQLPDSIGGARPHRFKPMGDDTYLVGFQKVNAPDDRRLHFYRLNANGDLISDQVLSFKSKSLYVDNTMTKQVIMMLPYERETLLETDSEDNIYTIHTEDFLVQVHDADGNYQKAYHYPFEKRNLVESDAVELFTNVFERRAIRGANLPGTWPAVAHFLIDDQDRMWVATITQNLQNYTWYVLEKSGEVTGSFELSREKKIMVIKNDFVYIKEYKPSWYSDRLFRYEVKF